MNYKIFKPYEDRMIAFSTEREGYFVNDTEGMSQEAYGSLNLCHYVNDNPDHVAHNRQLFCQYHNIEREMLFVPRQTHLSNVKRIHPGIGAACGKERRLPANQGRQAAEGIH